jgi:serine-type D-Ala-D-Ala carboxypeptidase (penicillin-binding protein 5/6)
MSHRPHPNDTGACFDRAVGISPLIPPSGSRRNRRGAARAGIAAAGLLVLALAVTLAALLGLFSRASAHPRSAVRSTHAHPAPPRSAPLARSPDGLVLGTPALALSGLGAQRQDPLQIRFDKPPRAGLLFDLDNGEVLWQRNALRRLRIASLTKMMTALIAARSAPDTPVLITRQAVQAPGSAVGVLPRGRRVALESLLYGLLLPSGNDAATAIAEGLAGSVPAFVAQMNAEGARLGLGCTRFSSPSGYYDEGNFSCAADLAVLAHDDLAQPRVARVTRTLAAVIPFPIKGGKLFLYNNNPLLIYRYPGATGLKTGYTLASGRCLVATAQRDGVRLGAVLLDSPAPGAQASRLLDLGFQRVFHQAPVAAPPMPPDA